MDFDAKDHHLVQEGHPKRSKWLMQNAVVVRLVEGEAFYVPQPEVVGPRRHSLCAALERPPGGGGGALRAGRGRGAGGRGRGEKEGS